MKLKSCFKILALLPLLVAGLSSCDPDTECRQSAAVYLKVVLTGDSLAPSIDTARLVIDTLAKDTVRFSSVKGLRVWGLGRDSLICDSSATVSALFLPLRPDSLRSEFVLAYNGQIDTLTIRHANDMQFISLACGCFVYHTIEGFSMSRHFLDSLHILNEQVTTSADDHLQLYFHKW